MLFREEITDQRFDLLQLFVFALTEPFHEIGRTDRHACLC